MEGVIAGVFDVVMNKKVKTEPKSDLLVEIESVKMRLETAASHFENQIDPDLIEASIYESKSLTARYRYLLREAKRQGLTKSMDNALKHSEHF